MSDEVNVTKSLSNLINCEWKKFVEARIATDETCKKSTLGICCAAVDKEQLRAQYSELNKFLI